MSRITELSSKFADDFKGNVHTGDALPKVSAFPTGLPSFDAIVQDCGGIPQNDRGQSVLSFRKLL